VLEVVGRNTARGIHTVGYEASIENHGTIDVAVTGDSGAGFAVSGVGVLIEGDGSIALNTGTIKVAADGGGVPAALAVGMAARGDGNRLQNRTKNEGDHDAPGLQVEEDDDALVVAAEAPAFAAALGMGLNGDQGMAENTRGL